MLLVSLEEEEKAMQAIQARIRNDRRRLDEVNRKLAQLSSRPAPAAAPQRRSDTTRTVRADPHTGALTVTTSVPSGARDPRTRDPRPRAERPAARTPAAPAAAAPADDDDDPFKARERKKLQMQARQARQPQQQQRQRQRQRHQQQQLLWKEEKKVERTTRRRGRACTLGRRWWTRAARSA